VRAKNVKILNLEYNLKNAFIKFEKSDAASLRVLKRFTKEFHDLVKQTKTGLPSTSESIKEHQVKNER
jgi:hypothetical protein